MRGTVAVVGGMVSLVFLGACGKGAGTSPSEKVLLTVGERKITVGEFQKEFEKLPPQVRETMQSPAGQKRFLEDHLTRRELLLQEARRRKVDERPEIVERTREFRERLLLETLVSEEIGTKVTVEEAEAAEYYAAHKEEFEADRIRARHILVATEKEAQDVLDRLGKKESFEGLARTLSLDKGSGAQGGDLGVFGRGQMVPEFEKAAFALKAGQVSGAVKSPFGYHIIKLVERQKGPTRTFDQIKNEVRQRLLAEKQRKRFEEWVATLRAGASIVIEESLLPVKGPAEVGPRPEQRAR